jgi:hypothetical protein
LTVEGHVRQRRRGKKASMTAQPQFISGLNETRSSQECRFMELAVAELADVITVYLRRVKSRYFAVIVLGALDDCPGVVDAAAAEGGLS